MMKPALLAASAALLALPALADHHGGEGPMAMAMKERWTQPETRAEAEARIAEHFAAFDADKDGAVTTAEIDAQRARMRETMAARMGEMQARMFDKLDADRNGTISKAEWDAHHAGMKAKFEARETADKDGKHHEKRMMMHRGGHHDMGARLMTRADSNNDGRITLAEVKAAALARFDSADANKDGTLTPEERRAHHQEMRQERRDKRGG
jgi:Ca2+-binding EF-hand superfamily protein